jgi:hypothetical protein
MLSVRTIAACLGLIAACALWSASAFSEDNKPRTLQPKPAQTVERPFGGPPNRVPLRLGKTCETPTVTCTLEEDRSVGSDCVCMEVNGPPVEGRVVP